MYPFDTAAKDIWDTDYKIKANFIKHKIDRVEKARFTIISIFSLILTTIYFLGNPKYTQGVNDIILALFCSGYFFLITEVLVKIKYFFSYSVAINNLSNFVEYDERGLTDESDVDQIKNPEIED